MNKWTKTAGLIFMAAASVYSDRAIAAKPAKPGSSADKAPATDVKLLEETDPFATAPTTAPTAVATSDAKSAPVAPVLVNPDGTFSLNITAGADIVEQLRVIGFQAQSSIIPSKDVHGSLPAMDLYNVTVHEALDALLQTNGYRWLEKGKFIYVYTAKEIADQEKAARVQNTEIFRLSYTPAANAVNMIKPALSADAQVAVTTPSKGGLTTGTTDTGASDHATEDMIVVTDYAENLDKVRAVLKEVDRRPQQILIEATILSARLSEDNALGVDFNIVGGVDFNSVFGNNGVAGTKTVNPSNNPNNPAGSVGTGNGFTKGITDGLKVGIVTNNVSVFLSALEGVTDTTVLANPKVLAVNKQKGEVIVGTETGYLTTTTTETSSTQTIEFLKTGTRLVFRPYIGEDGYIRMELHPEDSDGGLQTAQNLPYKNTTEVTSNVLVKDGHTIVIGGLFREKGSSTRSQIPGAGNLPVVGPLFRQQQDNTVRDEVIILITPHIVKDDAAYAELSDKEKKDAEKLRVGVRRGMMWWGRERLAEMNYEKAVEEMNKSNPDRKKALWDLDSATNLNPKMIEAIHLREEITGQMLTTTDGSSIRSYVSRAILADRAPATQPKAESGQAGPAFAAAPATRPVAGGPTSQPSTFAESDEAFNDDANQFAIAPTTSPATQPAVAFSDEQPASQENAAVDEQLAKTATSMPSVVTELPVEEIPAAPAQVDFNK